jgi:hypothetical protein
MKTKGTISKLRKYPVLSWFFPLVLIVLAAFVSSLGQMERRQAGGGPAYDGPKLDLLWEIGRRSSLAFGFRNFLADLAWLEAVQVSGSRTMAPGDYDRLYILIRTVNNFDPRFVVPYILGGLMVGDSPSHVSQALEILRRGRENHPREWRLPFYMGYLHYFVIGDPVAGGEALGEAARIPGSPAYLPFLAARMLSEGRRPETAMDFLTAMARNETDPVRKEILERRMREVIVERDIQDLEHAVEAYREKTGAWPETLTDLLTAGIRWRIPVEPNGGKYLLSSGGKVRSSKAVRRLKVFRPR